MPVLTKSECDAVEACIGEVERSTAAEIVVATVERADDYDDARTTFSAFCALASAALLSIFVPEFTVGALFLAQLLVFFGVRRLLVVPKLLRRVLSAARVTRAVDATAQRLFLAHRVFDTREHTGVLILLCELERRVTVLGDRGAHAVIDKAGWEAHVQTITAAFRAGTPATGLCNVIRALGDELSRELPITPDDIDELSNQVREH